MAAVPKPRPSTTPPVIGPISKWRILNNAPTITTAPQFGIACAL